MCWKAEGQSAGPGQYLRKLYEICVYDSHVMRKVQQEGRDKDNKCRAIETDVTQQNIRMVSLINRTR